MDRRPVPPLIRIYPAPVSRPDACLPVHLEGSNAQPNIPEMATNTEGNSDSPDDRLVASINYINKLHEILNVFVQSSRQMVAVELPKLPDFLLTIQAPPMPAEEYPSGYGEIRQGIPYPPPGLNPQFPIGLDQPYIQDGELRMTQLRCQQQGPHGTVASNNGHLGELIIPDSRNQFKPCNEQGRFGYESPPPMGNSYNTNLENNQPILNLQPQNSNYYPGYENGSPRENMCNRSSRSPSPANRSNQPIQGIKLQNYTYYPIDPLERDFYRLRQNLNPQNQYCYPGYNNSPAIENVNNINSRSPSPLERNFDNNLPCYNHIETQTENCYLENEDSTEVEDYYDKNSDPKSSDDQYSEKNEDDYPNESCYSESTSPPSIPDPENDDEILPLSSSNNDNRSDSIRSPNQSVESSLDEYNYQGSMYDEDVEQTSENSENRSNQSNINLEEESVCEFSPVEEDNEYEQTLPTSLHRNSTPKKHGKIPIPTDHHEYVTSKKCVKIPIPANHDDNSTPKKDNKNPIPKKHDDTSTLKKYGKNPIPTNQDDNSTPKKDNKNPIPKKRDEKSSTKKYAGKNPIPKNYAENSKLKKYGKNPIPTNQDDNSTPKKCGQIPIPANHDNNSTPKKHNKYPMPKKDDDNSTPKNDNKYPIPKNRDEKSSTKKFAGTNPIPKNYAENSTLKKYGKNPIPTNQGDNSTPKKDDKNPTPKRHDEYSTTKKCACKNPIPTNYAGNSKKPDKNPIPTNHDENSTRKKHGNNPIPTNQYENLTPKKHDEKPIPTNRDKKPIPTNRDKKPIPTNSDKNPIQTNHDENPIPANHEEKISFETITTESEKSDVEQPTRKRKRGMSFAEMDAARVEPQEQVVPVVVKPPKMEVVSRKPRLFSVIEEDEPEEEDEDVEDKVEEEEDVELELEGEEEDNEISNNDLLNSPASSIGLLTISDGNFSRQDPLIKRASSMNLHNTFSNEITSDHNPVIPTRQDPLIKRASSMNLHNTFSNEITSNPVIPTRQDPLIKRASSMNLHNTFSNEITSNPVIPTRQDPLIKRASSMNLHNTFSNEINPDSVIPTKEDFLKRMGLRRWQNNPDKSPRLPQSKAPIQDYLSSDEFESDIDEGYPLRIISDNDTDDEAVEVPPVAYQEGAELVGKLQECVLDNIKEDEEEIQVEHEEQNEVDEEEDVVEYGEEEEPRLKRNVFGPQSPRNFF